MKTNYQQRHPDEFVAYFSQDVRVWLERRAKLEGVHPLTLVREMVREQAENERFDVERIA